MGCLQNDTWSKGIETHCKQSLIFMGQPQGERGGRILAHLDRTCVIKSYIQKSNCKIPYYIQEGDMGSSLTITLLPTFEKSHLRTNEEYFDQVQVFQKGLGKPFSCHAFFYWNKKVHQLLLESFCKMTIVELFGYKGLFKTWLINYTHQTSKYYVEPQCESRGR